MTEQSAILQDSVADAKGSGGASSFDRYIFAMLIALEFLMSFTFLGYIHLPPISITTAYIPILVAACILGVPQAAVVGTVFGLCSMYKASATYVMASDMVFSPFLSGAPVKSLLLSVGTRTLFGLLIGLLFSWAKKTKHRKIGFAVIAACASRLQAAMVFSAMGLLFPTLGFNIVDTTTFIPGRGIPLALFCVAIVGMADALYSCKAVQQLRFCLDQSLVGSGISRHMKKGVIGLVVFILCMTVIAALYFTQRTVYMLGKHDVFIVGDAGKDLLHLQVQFMIVTLSLNMILLFLFLAVYQYMSYQRYLRDLDALTGVMGRRLFFYHCESVQERDEKQGNGWFLFLDVDYFKTINDTCGHPTGDRVLREIADALKRIFSACGAVGRVGGDEFAVMIEEAMTEERLRQKIETFRENISGILPEFRHISCSIGVCRFAYPQDVQNLLTQTDKILYQAKKRGRDCYVIGTLNEKFEEDNEGKAAL